MWLHLHEQAKKVEFVETENRMVVTSDWMWVLGLQREVITRYKISVKLEGMDMKFLLCNMLTPVHNKVLRF